MLWGVSVYVVCHARYDGDGIVMYSQKQKGVSLL